MNKRKTIKLAIKFVIIGAVLICVLRSDVTGMGICVQDDIIVSSVSGRVISHYNAGDRPVAGASVELLNSTNDKIVIVRTKSKPDGSFRFGKPIKPGEYILSVSYRERYRYYGGVQVEEVKPRTSQQEILITLGYDFLVACGGTSAAIISR